MTTVAVGIRFERKAWARHCAAAQARGLPLGTYIRQLLDEHEQVATAVSELRSSLERRVSDSGEGALQAAVLEILLILRQSAGPQKAGIAQKELERRGVKPWR
jgi:predicted DNA-binding ribbon-helix-helix protein